MVMFKWKKFLFRLDTCSKKINHFVNIFPISKVLKHQHHWGVFLQHHPKQRSHKVIFFNKFDGRVQSFEVFQPIWAFSYTHIIIQMAQSKLALLALCY
jgi:hypothetical protein